MDNNVNSLQTQVVEKTSKGSSKKWLVIALIVMFVLVLCASGIAVVVVLSNRNAQQNSSMSCQYNGATYQNGASFKSTDGCNTCGCNNGSVVCTEIACVGNDTPNPNPTSPNPAGGIEETLIGKLQVTSDDYFYGTTKYPDSIMNLKSSELQSITCSGQYEFNGTQFTGSNGSLEKREVINYLNTRGTNGGFKVSYCETPEGKIIVEYEHCESQCGGGIGTNVEFGIIKSTSNITADLEKVTTLPNQLGAYFTCDTPLALTKNNEFFIKCHTGDTANGTAAIYKVYLGQGNYTEVVRANF